MAANFLAGAAFVTLYYSLNGVLAMNRIGCRVTGTQSFNQAHAELVGAAAKSQWSTHMAPLCSSTTSLVRVGVRDFRTAARPEFRDTGAAAVGTGTGDAMPGQDALCITLRTAGSGKSFRGRVYIGGFNEAQNGPNGIALLSAVTGATDFLNSLNGLALTPNGLTMAVITKPQDDIRITKVRTQLDGTTETHLLSHQVAKPGQISDVTQVESRNASWETQRRRVNGRGAAPTSLDALVSIPL